MNPLEISKILYFPELFLPEGRLSFGGTVCRIDTSDPLEAFNVQELVARSEHSTPNAK